MRWNFYLLNACLIAAAAFCFYFVYRRFFELFGLKKGSCSSALPAGSLWDHNASAPAPVQKQVGKKQMLVCALPQLFAGPGSGGDDAGVRLL